MMTAKQDKEINFNDEWPSAQKTVIALLNQTHVPKVEWQDLFWWVYRVTSWIDPGGNQLIRNALSQNIERYVVDAASRIQAKSHESDEDLLRVYISEWSKFYEQANILPLPFKNVESQQVGHGIRTAEPRLPKIRQIMFEFWNQLIFSECSDRLLTAAIQLVERERSGENFDTRLVIGVRQSFVTMYDYELLEDEVTDIYNQKFERMFIDETVKFYRARACQFLDDNGVINYMTYADAKLEEEFHRANRYLENEKSVHRLIENCVDVLVIAYQDVILAECSRLISENDVEKLKLMYRLIRRTHNGIDLVLKYIDEHIRSEGLRDMHENAETISSDPEKYVQQLLAMFEKFSALVRDGFLDDARLLTARDKAFREVINDTSIFKLELSKRGGTSRNVESKCAELLANYCDLLLRRTQLSKRLTSEQIEEKLNQVLLVLKYVNNKDVFMRFHKAHLSRRLILEVSADQEKEEYMIDKLRENGMPSDLVNKLSRMLQDIEVNKDINSNFKKSLIGRNNNKTQSDLINLKVLNYGAWGRSGTGGGSERMRVSLPRELEDFVLEIEDFYKKQYAGRKLMWMHHWSHGTMIFDTVPGGHFDLEVTTFQMAVLFAFNDRAHEKLTLETMRLATELPDTELVKTLFSLVAFPKMKSQVLLCDNPSTPKSPRDFTDSTVFYINHDFHLIKNGKPQTRGKVNLIGRLQLTMEPTADKEHEEIIALREFRVQEAIVKILKTRKSITSAQLTSELVELLKPFFLPTRHMIKEQTEWLIENRYIARRDDDINTFVYLT
ncbi:hypothetical protein WR25_01186 [Diploscapter pachys]|uniref:Cullin-5 n=1 Tax=Diploscapter pachys TaxID=2018661 RepID=A0A2A2K227_9BILA|nr:hypothetical protein WR25_01186 [Diploscapter pachys]